MIKKTILGLTAAVFFATASFSAVTNVGFTLSSANLEASGSETQNSGATVNQPSKESDFLFGSAFIERQFATSGSFEIAIGASIVPVDKQIESIGAGTGTGATINVGNILTAYIQPTFMVSDSLSLYGKVGYSQGDLNINDLVRQATAANTTDSASTDGNTSKTLDGMVFGLGLQFNKDAGPFNFIRLDATHTDFDQVTHTNSNLKTLKADADMDVISLSIGKTF